VNGRFAPKAANQKSNAISAFHPGAEIVRLWSHVSFVPTTADVIVQIITRINKTAVQSNVMLMDVYTKGVHRAIFIRP